MTGLTERRINRVFLGWHAPPVASVAEWLLQHFATESLVDLSRVHVVVASTRGGRRLQELLYLGARQRGLELIPPAPVTTGQLPELLYRPRKKAATRLQRQLAWSVVLRDAPADQLTTLMARPPSADAHAAWFELARSLSDLCEELTQDGWRPAELTEQVPTIDRPRWIVLGEFYARYLKLLDGNGLSDRDEERLVALREARLESSSPVVLACTVDLNQTTRRMVRAAECSVCALIGAPPEWADWFDETGNVVPEKWSDAALSIDRDRIIPAVDPNDEAIRAVAALAGQNQDFGPDEVTIGVTDASLVEPVRQAFADAGYPPRSEIGMPLSQSGPARLLAAVREYVSDRSYANLAALLRHSDLWHHVHHGLDERFDPIVPIDALRQNHFCEAIEIQLPEAVQPKLRRQVSDVIAEVEKLLPSLDVDEVPLSQWSARLVEFLERCYPDRASLAEPAEAQLDLFAAETTRPTVPATQQALSILHERLERQSRLPSRLDVACPSTVALDLLLSRLAEHRTAEGESSDSIAIAGWLDLLLDDAPAMVVVGMRDQHVPAPVSVDPFLPGRLRTQLGIADNARRFARDAYTLQVLNECRPMLRLVAGRVDTDGNPSPPSSLLAACSARENAERVRLLLSHPPRMHLASDVETAARTRLPIPPAAAKTVKQMPVTYFADYLRCPYRFYLQRIEKIRPVEIDPIELAANQFGDLIHDTLEDFGRSRLRNSEDEGKIREYLLDKVGELSRKKYGEETTATIRVQTDQARARLQLVAQIQAERARQGWRIVHAEKEIGARFGVMIEAASGPMRLIGRIDRIDKNEHTQRWQILDYKTHDLPPMKKHFDQRKREWKDLQLPLYRHFLPALDIEGECDVGYFNIAKDPQKTGVHLAEFDEAMYASADAEARRIIDSIRAGHFEPNPEAATSYDDFGVICQTSVIGEAG